MLNLLILSLRKQFETQGRGIESDINISFGPMWERQRLFTNPLLSSGWFLACDWLALYSMWAVPTYTYDIDVSGMISCLKNIFRQPRITVFKNETTSCLFGRCQRNGDSSLKVEVTNRRCHSSNGPNFKAHRSEDLKFQIKMRKGRHITRVGPKRNIYKILENKMLINIAGFEVLTAVIIKSSIFWDITPYSPLKVNRCFGGICHLYFQGQRISKHEAGSNFFQLTTRSYISEDRNVHNHR
jgi:hypothetical protein